MIQGFINGIKNMMGNIGNAVGGVASKVKSFLHFSRPDEGPLRDYEKWMPDMIEGLSKTLNISAPKLYNASKELASKVAEGLDMSNMVNDMLKVNTDIVPNTITSSMNISINTKEIEPQNIMRETMEEVFSKYQGNNNGQPLHLQMYWGSKKIVDEVIDGINEKTRQTGKLQIRYT